MHWCTECGEPCYCDMDDIDYGDIPLTGWENCNHVCDEYENLYEEETEDEDDDDPL